jgi:hypothetical protein
VVSWRTAPPARQVQFSVVSTERRAFRDIGTIGSACGRGRSRFRIALHPRRPGLVRRLLLSAGDREGGQNRQVRLRLR